MRLRASRLTMLWLALSLGTTSFAQSEKRHLREGNRHYDREEYAKAADAYGKSTESKPDYYKGRFNQGNALYRIGDFDSAIGTFDAAGRLASDKAQRANAFYNQGNTYMELKQWDKAIQRYKQVLKMNPTDEEARYNLAYAQKMLQEQQSEGGSENQEQQQEQEQQEQEPSEDDQEQQQQPREQQLSNEQMEQLLKALEQQEQKVQEKVQEQQLPAKPSKTDKDW